MRTIALNDGWRLCGFDGYGEFLDSVQLPAALPNQIWLAATVPGSVYADLQQAGWIDDPLMNSNSLKAQWVEQWYWFYRREIVTPELATGECCRLVLHGVDLHALVFLNGELIAQHANVFRPLTVDITKRLQPGANELIVRVDSGLLGGCELPGSRYHLEVTAANTRRTWLRKPQYAARWDWSPRLMNVGLGGPVALEIDCGVRVEQWTVDTLLRDNHRRATLRGRIFIHNSTARPARVAATLALADSKLVADAEVDAPPGETVLPVELTLAEPKLWWPRELGEPYRYPLRLTVSQGELTLLDETRLIGVRRVEIQQPPAAEGRRFQIVVNGEPVFCKGANWVPPELLYPLTRDVRIDAIVELAERMHMNLLRIWGGGEYARERLLERCDEAGILIWHDLIFACGQFPGDDAAFRAEVEREVRYQVRRMGWHPSLAVWCGNNENEMGAVDAWIRSRHPKREPDHGLYHETFPKLLAQEDPERPYWPTSPWSPDGSHPNAQQIGDQHPWNVALMEAKGDYWAYRADASRFPNEGGMLGPSTWETLCEILPEGERRRDSRTWLHHDNTQNTWKFEPLLDHLLRMNLCAEPRGLRFEDYVRYAAILHGEALETGIDNWRRRKWDSAAAVFWMLNDTWPAAVSWTPFDYYLRCKPAFWYVQRAFEPVRAICVAEGDACRVVLVNDHQAGMAVEVRYGLFGLAGGRPIDESATVEAPANGALEVGRFPLAAWDEAGRTTHGAFARVTPTGGRPVTQRLFRARFHELAWGPAAVLVRREGEQAVLSSEAFAWSVVLEPVAGAAHFDVLPGLDERVDWPAERPLPVVRAANPAAEILRPGGG